MQAASTKLLQSDRVMLVSAGATRHRPSLEGLQLSCNQYSNLQKQLPPRNEGTASAA